MLEKAGLWETGATIRFFRRNNLNHNPLSTLDPSQLRRQWLFPPEITFLNHGSFGPAPRPVLEARQRWLEEVQSNPMDFFVRKYGGYLETVRQRLGAYVGAQPGDLAFVANATVGMNAVVASVRLQPGDEVLLNDHEYGAVIRIWQRACDQAGAKLIVQPIPVPLQSPEQIVDAIVSGMTPRTRLVVFSHITSATAIIFPVEALCREARRRSVAVCIDGPHAVAMQPLNIAALDCDYYLASCHKWLAAPIGCGFMYIHPRAQETFQPATLSWGRLPEESGIRWNYELEWAGTHDPSATLAIPAAMDFLDTIGLDAFRDYTHRMARYAREKMSELPGIEPLTADSRDSYGSMVALQIPNGEAMPLQTLLWQRYQIESLVLNWNNQRLLRVCCHVYTSEEDLERLTTALRELLF
jgi:isopenicillin-N epimerase